MSNQYLIIVTNGQSFKADVSTSKAIICN